MELARILSYDEDDNGGHGSDVAESACVAKVLPDKVVATRALYPRRKSRLESLRDQIKTFEFVVANLDSALSDGSSTTEDDDGAVDADTERMRQFLRRSSLLQRSKQRELDVRRELTENLRYYQQKTLAVHKLMRGVRVDDWYWQCERWRAMTAQFVKPFSRAYCETYTHETLQAIKSYKMPKRASAKGLSFFGWWDVQRLDGDQQCVHFVSRKTYRRFDFETVSAMTWQAFHDADKYKSTLIGPTVQLHHEVVQRVTPEISILQTIEKYPGVDRAFHSFSLVFRKQTATGYIIAVRAIASPDLHHVLRSDGLSVTGNFYWLSWDVCARDELTGQCIEYETSFTGYIGADDPSYAQRWQTEVLLMLVRCEGELVGSQPLIRTD